MSNKTSNNKSISEVVLFEEKKECCGCGACLNACPKNCISMILDEYGFIYPKIDDSLCIKCKTCKNVCAFQHVTETTTPFEIYASAMKNEREILDSASGGVFAVFAKSVLSNGGIVFGVTMEYINGVLTPMHIAVDNLNDMPKLLGSKYVHSSIGQTYNEVKNYLMSDKEVLFSGTPCQVAGVKSFLKKDYENLLTVDIICHGVPSAKFFQDYIKQLEIKHNRKIIDFKFRDKTKGWGCTGKVIYKNSSNEIKEKLIPCNTSSYYKMFLDSDIYRENCYSCKYASIHRPGDISVGDYWGIQQEHAELMEKNGGLLSEHKGISCLIVNTEKGKQYLEKHKSELNLFLSTFEKVARHNEQLNAPSHTSKYREDILKLYRTKGYEAVELYFRKKLGMKYYYYTLKNIIPSRVKKSVKRMLKAE